MNKLKKILAIALAACTLFAVGCKKDKGGNENAETISADLLPEFEGGIHEMNYTETSDFLVKNNKTDYAILVPAQLSEHLKFAAEDLKKLFYDATKCDLRIVKDDAVDAYTADKKYISLGNTTYAQAANVVATPELERYGYSIKTVGKTIFINANLDLGVTYGVYGFLQLQFNFDCFSDQYYVIDKKNDAPLLDFAVRNVPDLGAVVQSSPFQEDEALYRMGCLSKGDFCMPQETNSVHSSMKEFPASEYADAHPKWYAADRKQLCYNANGDADERAALVQAVADKITAACQKTDNSMWAFTFGQADTGKWCTCDACKASLDYYGSDNAVQIKFINDIAGKVQEWMETEEGKPYARDFEIRYLVYQKTIEAPVKWDDATSQWVPIDDSVIPADHTMPQMAPIDIDHLCDLTDECNKSWLERLEKWTALLSHSETTSAMFNYYRNYTADMLYFDSYTNMQNIYRVYARMNPSWFYEEGPLKTNHSTKWESLKGYLISKLAWDVNSDIESLTEKFFQHYFGEGGDEMYDVFRATRAVWGKNRLERCDSRSKFADLYGAPEAFPEELAVTSLEKFDKALSDIEYLKKIDGKLYDTFYKNLVTERVSYAFMLINFYETRYDPDYIYQLKLQTKADVELVGINDYTQTAQIAELWNKWGI